MTSAPIVDLGLGDVGDDQQQAGIVGELQLDLGVGVATQQLVDGDRDHAPVDGAVDEGAGHRPHVEAGGGARRVAGVAARDVVAHAAVGEEVGQRTGDA